MAKPRKNLTLNQKILEFADDIMKAEAFDDFSELVSNLIRERHARLFNENPGQAIQAAHHLREKIVQKRRAAAKPTEQSSSPSDATPPRLDPQQKAEGRRPKP